MKLKIGDKVKLKPLHICERIGVFLNDDMEKYWLKPTLTVKSLARSVNGEPVFIAVEDKDEWVFDLQWVDHIIPETYLPDTLFTLED